MTDILEQFKNLAVSKFEIVLQSQTEAILPALIGSTLRGAFGHALKAISCSMSHQNCDQCFLSDVCNYTTIFEPTSKNKLNNLPRPFVFSPPIPPLTKEISKTNTLKIRVSANGEISFGLILIGDAVNKLPYFIYAFELMARHGLGSERHSFKVVEVFQVNENSQKYLIYEPHYYQIETFESKTLKDYVVSRLENIETSNNLKIRLETPLRIRRKDQFGHQFLLEEITFFEFFKQCSLRLKLLSENYGMPLDYDYQNLMKKSQTIEISENNLWRHDSMRYSNRQNEKLDLDGMLGEIKFGGQNLKLYLPYLLAAEFLQIGSACGLGLGKFCILGKRL